MHELSIAEALVDTVRRAAPPGAVVRVVHLRAGPMRAIAPEALAWAWQAATADSDLGGSAIDLESLPWTLHCPACDRTFTVPDLFVACACGNTFAHPVAEANEVLQIISLTIDDPQDQPPSTSDQQPTTNDQELRTKDHCP